MGAHSCPTPTTSTTLQPSVSRADLAFRPPPAAIAGFLPLILYLELCILILLSCPSDQCTSERARSVKIIRVKLVVRWRLSPKGYDLEYAWRAVGRGLPRRGYYLAAAEA